MRSHFSTSELEKYIQNPFTALQNNKAVFDFLKQLWIFNYGQVGFGYIGESIFESIKNAPDESVEVIKTKIESCYRDKPFIQHCKNSRMGSHKMDFGFDILKPLIDKERTSFLDFGCGRLALLKKISYKNDQITHLYGYDPKSNPKNFSLDARIKFFSDIEELKKLENVGTVFTSFVLHHLTYAQLEQALTTINTILIKGGSFIILEETFPQQEDISLTTTSLQYMLENGYELNQNLTYMFQSLSIRDKFLAIFISDFIANLKHLSYMPWTMEYHSIDEWSSFIERFGFGLQSTYYFGVPQSGRVKQGPTGMLVFKKG